jgi:hypothetical protein
MDEGWRTSCLGREPTGVVGRLTTVRIVALALALVLLAACSGGDEVVTSDDPRPSEVPPTTGSTQPPGSPSTAPTAPRADPGGSVSEDQRRYTATATILESPEHGPQLCLGGVATSYPPQCGGPDIVGWDWEDAPGHESANGTTWGHYTVVGTWDGQALTLTEPPTAPRDQPPPDDADRFATPCPEPEGGWQVVDEAKATDEAMQAAIEHARAQPDVGGVWVDQSINPAAGDEPVDEEAMNDPAHLILNITFTGDLERHEAEIRQRWGGPLCVSRAAASMADLERIRHEVHEDVGARLLFSSIDEVRGRLEVGVVTDDGLQARFDERYGHGVVLVDGALRPVEA